MDVIVGAVTGEETAINRDGSEPGRLLQIVATDVWDTRTAETFQGGEEYNPPVGCRVVMIEAGVGYKLIVAADDGQAPVMTPGGKRIYSTLPDGSGLAVDMRFGSDGSISMLNQNGYGITMSPAGAFQFIGTSSNFNHPITATQVTGASKVLGTHTHGGVMAGTATTGVPS